MQPKYTIVRFYFDDIKSIVTKVYTTKYWINSGAAPVRRWQKEFNAKITWIEDLDEADNLEEAWKIATSLYVPGYRYHYLF